MIYRYKIEALGAKDNWVWLFTSNKEIENLELEDMTELEIKTVQESVVIKTFAEDPKLFSKYVRTYRTDALIATRAGKEHDKFINGKEVRSILPLRELKNGVSLCVVTIYAKDDTHSLVTIPTNQLLYLLGESIYTARYVFTSTSVINAIREVEEHKPSVSEERQREMVEDRRLFEEAAGKYNVEYYSRSVIHTEGKVVLDNYGNVLNIFYGDCPMIISAGGLTLDLKMARSLGILFCAQRQIPDKVYLENWENMDTRSLFHFGSPTLCFNFKRFEKGYRILREIQDNQMGHICVIFADDDCRKYPDKVDKLLNLLAEESIIPKDQTCKMFIQRGSKATAQNALKATKYQITFNENFLSESRAGLLIVPKSSAFDFDNEHYNTENGVIPTSTSLLEMLSRIDGK